jgi:hypothetical protein
MTHYNRKKLILERSKWKPFGEALINNKGITTIGDDVFFEKKHVPFFYHYRYFIKHNTFSEEYFKSLEHLYINKLSLNISYPSKKITQCTNQNTSETNIMGDKINKNRFIPSWKNNIDNNIDEPKPVNYILKISNLPDDISSETINDILIPYSKINKIIIPTYYDTNNNKGYAFIYLVDQSAIDIIINDLNNYRIDHNVLLFEKIIDKYNKSFKNKNNYSNNSSNNSKSTDELFNDLKNFSQQFSKNN